MSKFCLTILGVNAATPAFGRFPSAQVLQVDNQYFLVDCGEGAQIRLSDFNLPRFKIKHIFISHLHGDHVFGLPGLLFSYALNARQEPLHLYSPPGLKEMIMAQLNPSGKLGYELFFHEFDASGSAIVFENQQLSVVTIPLLHRIPTAGFLFREKAKPRNILPEMIEAYQLTIPQIKAAKSGTDIQLPDGHAIPNALITKPPAPPRSYAYMSDTAYHEEIIPLIKGVDLLYHETTFCQDLVDTATVTMHSTALQAGQIAAKAKVGTLITGHYSSRYKELEVFQQEAQTVFPNTVLGLEGNVYEVKNQG